MSHESAIGELRRVLERARRGEGPELPDILAAREEVLATYQPVFHRESLGQLTPDIFRGFLSFKNNRHWKAIHRQAGQLVADMDALRSALATLLDESRPLAERLAELRPHGGDPRIKGLARSVITPILLVSYPDRYGVLNRVAETAMKKLGLWPELEAGADFATRYVAVNEVLKQVASELGVDLWTLDALWWGVDVSSTEEAATVELAEIEEPSFGLERHLHEFLRDNWDYTELGAEWVLLEEDGEVVGYEYPAGEIGKIDLLAKHRSKPRWLVVELKRGHTSDQAVGQALRYRGWVRRHLASVGEVVEAMVIGHAADPRLYYALDGVDDVSARTYSVQFTLQKPLPPWEYGSEEP